ncbi:hypothetical protein [Thermococcus barossii]|uniref:Uncharacterized protein n=1 Tax=Thermococcus barossii TaxID=54077 RepID=A0A2Z2MDU5_9EURY|nr:hypothetical protein [Thermococcus barossii]ASJ04016.1 hypothetical protein A3L01_01015 [Thermococcus barossii]
MIKEYIPYIKRIADAYPEDPSFYDKIMQIPDLPDLERDIKPLNPEIYNAVEALAEKLKEDLKAPEPVQEKIRSQTKTSPIDLSKAKLEVLSILNGLEFAGFSDDAKARAVEKLSAKIAELSSGGLTQERVGEGL